MSVNSYPMRAHAVTCDTWCWSSCVPLHRSNICVQTCNPAQVALHVNVQVALVATVNLDLGTTLLFTGFYNIFSGLGFGIPMCVQPMKAIAAVALSSPDFTLPQIMGAGMFVSAVVIFLGVTRTIDVINKLIPIPIVRGIQLSVGIKLAMQVGKLYACCHQCIIIVLAFCCSSLPNKIKPPHQQLVVM